MPGPAQARPGLENDRHRVAIALERVGWSLLQTGHEPIHHPGWHPVPRSFNFYQPDNDCVTHQPGDVVNIQPFH